MTIKDFICYLDKDKVLSGDIGFRVIDQNGSKYDFSNNWSGDAEPCETLEQFINQERLQEILSLKILDDCSNITCYYHDGIGPTFVFEIELEY